MPNRKPKYQPRKKYTAKRRAPASNFKSQSIVLNKPVYKQPRPDTDAVLYKGIGIPAKFYTKLRYTEAIALTSVAYTEPLYRMNSVYDPVYAMGGGQPMYHDELSQLYDNYCVYGSKITATFINRSATTETAFVRAGIYPLVNSGTAVTPDEAIERDNCIYAYVGPNTGDQGCVTMSTYADVYKVYGRERDERDDALFTASTSASPVNTCFWHVFAGTIDESTALNMYVNIELIYYVKYFSRAQVLQS